MVARVVADGMAAVEDSLEGSNHSLLAVDEEGHFDVWVSIEDVEELRRDCRAPVVEAEEDVGFTPKGLRYPSGQKLVLAQLEVLRSVFEPGVVLDLVDHFRVVIMSSGRYSADRCDQHQRNQAHGQPGRWAALQ
ncbi:MAG TPA: hypothetical protein VMP13_05265 [Acidimicrobiia bacterium]|nr:hypothetical protein [Acidimicrobiia bacterium]